MKNNVKQNGDVMFIEDGHIYVNVKNSDIKYTSVTSVIKEYHEEFDEDFWSSYKALEKLMGDSFRDIRSLLLSKKKIDFDVEAYVNPEEFKRTKEFIIASYEEKRKLSSEYGTEIHRQKEEKFYSGSEINPKDCGFLLHDGFFACERNNFDLNRSKAVLPEYLIYYSDKDNLVNLAGQMDLLIKDNNDIYIYDYKTNENGIESKSYYNSFTKTSKKMFHPLNNLDDCKLMHYTMQLSIYAWMLQQINPAFNIKRLCLIHIDRQNKETEIDVDYRKDDVIKLIKSYKRKQKINNLRNESN